MTVQKSEYNNIVTISVEQVSNGYIIYYSYAGLTLDILTCSKKVTSQKPDELLQAISDIVVGFVR